MLKGVCESYCHVMPGRLRVRVAGLKRNQEAASSLELLMRSQAGIDHVCANALTGNLLCRFDQKVTSHEEVLENLIDLGFTPLPTMLTEREAKAADTLLNEVGMNIGMYLVKTALKQALSGSAASILLELI